VSVTQEEQIAMNLMAKLSVKCTFTVSFLFGPAPFQISGFSLFQSRTADCTTLLSGSTSLNPVMFTPPYRKLSMSSSSIDWKQYSRQQQRLIMSERHRS